MIARRLAMALGVAVLLASGTYVFVYLYRWEWNRALFAAALFIATEVAIGTAVVLEKLRSLSSSVQELRVLDRVREARPEPKAGFAWLQPEEGQLGVFVPILMGAGVVLSAVAWVVERLARATAGAGMERALAHRLSALALPAEGLLPGPQEPTLLDLR